MDEHDAVIMMMKKLQIRSAGENMIDLVRALSFMPLALSQAASYINRRAPRCSIPEYLERFNEIIATPNEDFEEEDDINRDPEARNSILATWHISLAHILEVRNTAADLLSLMSFFDRQTIPEALLKPHGSQNGVSRHTSPEPSPDSRTGRTLAPDNNHVRGPRQASSSTDAKAFEEDIVLLKDYSFVSVTTVKNTFKMHRLVQLATQRWLRDQDGQHQLSHWQGRFIKIVHDAFPTSWNAMSGNVDICHDLMPHASLAIAVQLVHPTKKVRLLQAELEYRCALHMFERGAYAESGRLATHAMEAFEQLLGPNKQDTGSAMKLLVRVKRQQRKFDEAEDLQLQICEREKVAHGEEHPDILMSPSGCTFAEVCA